MKKYEDHVSTGIIWDYKEVAYEQEQLDIINKSANNKYSYYYSFNLSLDPFLGYRTNQNASIVSTYLTTQKTNLIRLSQDKYEWLGLKKYSKLSESTICAIPSGNNEVAISDLRAELYLQNGFYDSEFDSNNLNSNHVYKPKSLDDIIGKKLLGKYKITGIFSSEDQIGEVLSQYVDTTQYDTDILEKDKLLHNYTNSFSLSSFLYFSETSIENITSNSNTVAKNKSIIVNIKNDFTSAMALINKLSFDNYRTHIKNEFSSLVSEAQLKRGQIDLLIKIIISICLIINFLICLNLFYSNIKAMNKTIGILKSIGC